MSTLEATAESPPRFTVERALAAAPYALIAALFVIGSLTIAGYSAKSNVIALLVLSSFLGIASVGQTLAIIVGGIDLSIPATIGMANVVLTQLYGEGMSFWKATLIVMALSVIIGVANAVLSILLNVHTLIVTLGIGLVVTGETLAWSQGSIGGDVPTWLTEWVSVVGTTGPIPIPTVIVVWLLLAIVMVLFLRSARMGREIYASGSNPLAAKHALVRSRSAIVVSFAISAVCAAVVGILFAGYSGAADVTVGQPYLFQTITAVVVGGTSLLGGRGGYAYTIAGALIISQLTALLIGFGFGPSMQQALLGVLIVILVILYGRETHVSTQI